MRFWGKAGKRIVFFEAIVSCLLCVFLAEIAHADSIKGLLEFDYNNVNTETVNKASGQKTETDASSWAQKYILNLEKNFFPNLRLSAGGIFEMLDQDTTVDGDDRDSNRKSIRPYADLLLDNKLYRAGLGYSRREDKQQSTGVADRTDVNELYSTILGWRPEGLPTFDLRIDKNDLYDKNHQIEDSTNLTYNMNTRYANDKIDIQYNPILQDYTNRIDNYELENLTHNGRLSYSDTFFNRRTNFGTTYNVIDLHRKVLAHGTGDLKERITGISQGLFLESNSPASVVLLPVSDLIDGQYGAIASINLGTSSTSTRKNIGLDFGTATEVDTLRVWVDTELAQTISDFFTWDIYSSTDNNTWVFEETVTLAPFNVFQNYFDLDFTRVTARYIKVVVNPLRLASVPPDSADAKYANILVSELQPFSRTPLPDGETKTSLTTHQLNMDARTRITDWYSLFHDVSFFYTKTNPGQGERSTLSNVLSATHRFSPIWSGNARVLREDIQQIASSGFAHGYNVVLRADPLKTMSNTLLLGGRKEEVGDDKTTKNSMSLQNRAELYKGIDAYLDAGLSWQSENSGQDQEATSISMGLNVVPHRTMTITSNYSEFNTDYSGGSLPDSTKREIRTDVGMTWRPFRTVYLVASYGRVEQESRSDTLKNYSLNWSPFPYGTLQLQLDYSEELHSEDQSKETIFRPGLRWEIAPRINLTITYYQNKSDSIFQTIDVESFNANIKINY